MTRLLPRSLAGRLIALLLLALIATQVATFLLYASERNDAVRAALRGQILSQAAAIVLLLRATPAQDQGAIVRAVSTRRLRFWLADESAVDPGDPEHADNFLARRLARMLEAEPGTVLVEIRRDEADFLRWRRAREERLAARAERDDDGAERAETDDDHGRRHWRRPPPPLGVKMSVLMADGRWLNSETLVPPVPPALAWPPLVAMGGMAAAILIIVSLMVRRIAGPMDRLASAADRLGRGEDQPPLPEEGPEEVRRTTRAFNRMSERLHRFVRDRTRMLAAISHDLRTPITTLRLRAEFVDDQETRERILATLDEMQQMAEASLAFAREEAKAEPTRSVDLAALVESLCSDLADLGYEVTCRESERLPYPCRPLALKRALRNLIENAVGYGKRARVSLERQGDGVVVVIDDDGPGIPEDRQEDVFQPFVRLEESRSKETGGIGLGMAIARSIVRGHGGDIALQNRPEGGLRVTLRLPDAPAREDRRRRGKT